MILTDSQLKPSDRFIQIVSEHLAKQGYIYKSKQFVRAFTHGKQVISLSFISQAGYVYGLEVYSKVIFTEIENLYKKLFGLHWSNWTVHNQSDSFHEDFFDAQTEKYTDLSLNRVAERFITQSLPMVESHFARFPSYEQLNLAYNADPSKTIPDVVPAFRMERRILMGLLLVNKFQPERYEQVKQAYLNAFASFDEFMRNQQKDSVFTGISKIDQLDPNTYLKSV